MSAIVSSFFPFIVRVPACIELLLVTAHIELFFGSFKSEEEARSWMAKFELARAELTSLEDITVEGVFNEAGIQTQPFVCATTYVCDVHQVGVSARQANMVIPYGAPEVAAAHIDVYALQALDKVVSVGLHYVEDEGDE